MEMKTIKLNFLDRIPTEIEVDEEVANENVSDANGNFLEALDSL